MSSFIIYSHNAMPSTPETLSLKLSPRSFIALLCFLVHGKYLESVDDLSCSLRCFCWILALSVFTALSYYLLSWLTGYLFYSRFCLSHNAPLSHTLILFIHSLYYTLLVVALIFIYGVGP